MVEDIGGDRKTWPGLTISKGLVRFTEEGLGADEEEFEVYEEGNPDEQWTLLEQMIYN